MNKLNLFTLESHHRHKIRDIRSHSRLNEVLSPRVANGQIAAEADAQN